MFTSEPAAWVCILPSAIFDSLPIMPTMSARAIPRRAACRSADADEVAHLDERLLREVRVAASSRTPRTCRRWSAPASRCPRSRATSIACTTLALYAAVEYGFTIPLVPRMRCRRAARGAR